MYLFGVIRSFFKVKNIPSTLYFIANCFIIYYLFSSMQLFETGLNQNAIINGVIGLALNFIIFIFMLSPIGEAIIATCSGGKKWTKSQCMSEELYNLACEVYENCCKVNPKLSPKIKFYIAENNHSVNAFAIGRRTVVLTRGILELDKSVIAGVIAHEFGHLSNCDCDLSLAIYASNILLLGFMITVKITLAIVEIVMGVFSFTRFIGSLFAFLGNLFVGLIYCIWTRFGLLLSNISSRAAEYKADKFAVDSGYGQMLMDGLKTIDPSMQKHSVLSLLGSTHPDTPSRVEKIALALESGSSNSSIDSSADNSINSAETN